MSIEDYQRNGNDKDVENLKRVFHTQRKCQFAELANWKSSDIVGTLSQDEKLIQLFYPNGDCKCFESTAILIYFKESHQEAFDN